MPGLFKCPTQAAVIVRRGRDFGPGLMKLLAKSMHILRVVVVADAAKKHDLVVTQRDQPSLGLVFSGHLERHLGRAQAAGSLPGIGVPRNVPAPEPATRKLPKGL